MKRGVQTTVRLKYRGHKAGATSAYESEHMGERGFDGGWNSRQRGLET